MAVVDVVFTVGATTYRLPVISIKPAPSVLDQPEPMLVGQATSQTGVGVYSTYCKGFSGPAGQEFWDLNSEEQGYRSGSLAAPFGYLQLPISATLGLTETATTTPLVQPSSIGVALPAATYGEYRTVLPMGKEIHWCAAGNPDSWSQEYNGTANVTQTTTITELKIPGSPYSRLYAAFASSTHDANYNIFYSDDLGDTWADTSLAGEQITAMPYHHHWKVGTYLIVAERDGTVTRYDDHAMGSTAVVDPTPGRVTFLAGEFTSQYGVRYIKNGKLYGIDSDDPSTNFYDVVNVYPGLSGLTCGTLVGGTTVVTSGIPSGIWRVTRGGDVTWIGLPPNMAGEYARIVYLLGVEADLIALATNTAGTNTTVLVCPNVLSGRPPEDARRGHDLLSWLFRGAPQAPYTPAHAAWQPVATIAKKPYACSVHPLRRYSTYQKSQTLFILCYDGSGSYIYHMPMPTGGAVAPGGSYASGTSNRVLPTFAPMPDLTGPFFGVEVGYDIDEVGSGDEAIAVKYSTDGSDPTTEIGTINTVGRGATTLSLSTPVAARVVDLKVEMTRGSTATYTPRVLWLAPVWHKKRPLRQSWLFEVDTIEYMRKAGKTYDGAMVDVAAIHDATIPPSMTIGNLTTTYKIDVERVTPEWGEAETPDRVGPIQLLVQEIP